jgi:hypothetical protein
LAAVLASHREPTVPPGGADFVDVGGNVLVVAELVEGGDGAVVAAVGEGGVA